MAINGSIKKLKLSREFKRFFSLDLLKLMINNNCIVN